MLALSFRFAVLSFSTLLVLLCSTGHAASPKATEWPLSIDIPSWQLQDVRTQLRISTSESGAIAGHSPNAAPRILGLWRYALARIWGVPLQRGAWLHLAAQQHPDGRITGVLTSAFAPPLTLECKSHQAPFECSLHKNAQEFGRLRVHVQGGTAKPTGQIALAQRIRRTLEAEHYRPANLQQRPWLGAFKRMNRLFARAQDDLDVLAAWRQLAPSLPDSHVNLLRSGSEIASVAPGPSTNINKHVKLSWHGDMALLRISSFALDTEQASLRFAEVFHAINAKPASKLIIDLRGNSGGNLSAMLVAGHLFEHARPAGCFVTRRWWTEHSTAPTPKQALELPTIEQANVAEFRAALAKHAALCGRVQPQEPVYTGIVQVLIDGQSASATEPLADLLKSSGRAKLYGAQTAGAMLSSERVSVGDGWQLLVPVADYFSADGRRLEGVGVRPTVSIAPAKALKHLLDRTENR